MTRDQKFGLQKRNLVIPVVRYTETIYIQFTSQNPRGTGLSVRISGKFVLRRGGGGVRFSRIPL